MDRYRIPTIRITGHDPRRWDFGRPWIQGLNSGDARRDCAYLQTALPLRVRASRSEPALLRQPDGV